MAQSGNTRNIIKASFSIYKRHLNQGIEVEVVKIELDKDILEYRNLF